MRKAILIPLFILAAFSLWGQSEYYNTIEFRNNTSGEILYLFFSPSDSGYWGPDVLGDSRTLMSKQSVEFYISYPDETNSFDFMGIDEFGNIYEIYDEPITDGEAAVIVINKSSKTDEIDLDILGEMLLGLEIVNSTGKEIYFLFISPADSQMYGIDFLDSMTTVMPDDSVSVLLFSNDTETDFDIQAWDEDDNSYSFSLSLDPELEYQYVEIVPQDMDEEYSEDA